MASPADGIKSRLRNYFATWLPMEEVDLGDVGTLDGNFFTHITNLKDSRINIDFKEKRDPDPASLDIQSESGVSMAFKGAGKVSSVVPNVPTAEAGIAIEFSHAGAFIFEAPEIYDPHIEEILELEDHLRQAYAEGNWQSHWVVVTRVVEAPSATILVSESSQSKVEFSAKADFGLADLGKAELGLSRWAQSGAIVRVVGARNIIHFSS
jgi:hypothetical protein